MCGHLGRRCTSFSPRIFSTGNDYQLARDPLAAVARIPRLAFERARVALQHGPVLVQVARSGYVPSFPVSAAHARAL